MKKSILFDYVYLFLGAFFMALAVVVFLTPSKVAAGGPPGIAILLGELFGVNKGLAIALINMPLMLLGMRTLGGSIFFRTIVAVVCISLCTYFTEIYIGDSWRSSDRMLNTLYGAVLIGSGLGFMFKGGGSSGGWTMLARLLSNKFNIGVGQSIFLLDVIVIGSSALIFSDAESVLLGGLGIYISGKVVDLILTGSSGVKIVHISCIDAEQLNPQIVSHLGTLGSIVKANSFQDGCQKDLIFLTVDQSQIDHLHRLVLAFDPLAYMVVMDAADIRVSAVK